MTIEEQLQPIGEREDLSLVPVERLAEYLELPKVYLVRLTKAGQIPYLPVGVQKRYNLTAVRRALVRMATKSDGNMKGERACTPQE